MSNLVTVQTDISTATSGGLMALSKVSGLLATLSADDVTPTAILQIQHLGTMFHLNGPLAEKVPDVLRMCQSYRFERFAVSIGWRKGDTASLLADTAGGQAAAMLLLCLSNSCQVESCGNILYKLCLKLLPVQANVSSPAQLCRVMDAIRPKLGTLAYGNHLAHHVTRIRQAYLGIGFDVPQNLLEEFNQEATVEILDLISCATCEVEMSARFVGSSGSGYLLGLLMALCPDDCLVTVEDIIIHRGARCKIILNITGSGLLSGRRERLLMGPPFIVPVYLPTEPNISQFSQLQYKWNGWLSTRLDIYFTSFGYPCPEIIKTACCSVILRYQEFPAMARFKTQLYQDCIQSPFEINKVLREIFGIYTDPISTESCFMLVKKLCQAIDSVLKCSESCHRYFSFLGAGSEKDGFVLPQTLIHESSHQFAKSCGHKSIWSLIWATLIDGLCSLFVKAPSDAILPESVIKLHREERTYSKNRGFYSKSVLAGMIFHGEDHLGFGGPSSVIYPQFLHHFELPEDRRIIFNLVNGQFIINNRYYGVLDSASTDFSRVRDDEKLNLPLNASILSDIRLENLQLTAFEEVNAIKIVCEVGVRGERCRVNLQSNLLGFITATASSPCAHSRLAPLERCTEIQPFRGQLGKGEFFDTSSHIGIFMTKGNRQAQLLAMRKRTLVQLDTCLQCVWDEAVWTKMKFIILT